MNTIKLEKQMRIVPLICIAFMLLLRDKAVNDVSNPIWLYIVIGLGILGVGSFFFRMYLEKKNGTFVAKRYYLVYFFIIISAVMFVYQLMQV